MGRPKWFQNAIDYQNRFDHILEITSKRVLLQVRIGLETFRVGDQVQKRPSPKAE
jgi:hypothetical protein